MLGSSSSSFVGNSERKSHHQTWVNELATHETTPLFNPNASLLVAVPVSLTYTHCSENVANLSSRESLEVPVQLFNSSSIASVLVFPDSTHTFVPTANVQASGNEHLVGFSTQFQCGPPLPPPMYHGRKQKPKNHHRWSVNLTTGLSKWYLKRTRDKMMAASASKSKLQRSQKALKRLNNHYFMQRWKMDKRRKYEECEEIRESKMEILRRKGIKATRKTKCSLWNCPRRDFSRKKLFTPLDLSTRSLSRLSNLSRKSRSPIVFRRSV